MKKLLLLLLTSSLCFGHTAGMFQELKFVQWLYDIGLPERCIQHLTLIINDPRTDPADKGHYLVRRSNFNLLYERIDMYLEDIRLLRELCDEHPEILTELGAHYDISAITEFRQS